MAKSLKNGDFARSATPPRLWSGQRLAAGATIDLPEPGVRHVAALRLHEGDAVRCTGTGGQRITAIEPAEVLVWEMHATLR